MRSSNPFDIDWSVPTERQPDYATYIRLMEKMRLNYGRAQRGDVQYHPSHTAAGISLAVTLFMTRKPAGPAGSTSVRGRCIVGRRRKL